MVKNLVPKKNPDMISRLIGDELLLVPVYKTSDEINCIYSLNKVASCVWGWINDKRSVEDLKKKAMDKFDATAQEMDKEMTRFLKELKEIKAIEM